LRTEINKSPTLRFDASLIRSPVLIIRVIRPTSRFLPFSYTALSRAYCCRLSSDLGAASPRPPARCPR
jgi:hypothetical protein